MESRFFDIIRILILSIACAGAASGGAYAAPARLFSDTLNNRVSTRTYLRELVLGSQAESASPKEDWLVRFYTTRDFAPVWSGSALAASLAGQVRAALLNADQHGLRSADYAATASRWDATPANPRQAAEYDISLTSDLLRYARDLRKGRVRPKDVYKDVDLTAEEFDPVAALTIALESHSIAAFLAELPPRHPEYRRLVEALTTYRAIDASGGWPSIPGQGEIALQGSDARLKVLKTRLAYEDTDLSAIPTPSTDQLRDAVKRFQSRHGLNADGRVGPGTLAELNVPASLRVEQIAANLERWRWLPRTFERHYIRVDVPDESLDFVRDGDVVLSSKVVIGRRNSPTPILRTTIYWVVANPPWDIPDDIAASQFLPQLRKNPNYLAAHNMVLVNGPVGDPQGKRIDWRKVSSTGFPYHVVQIPGPDSALGYLMLDSPNDFDVYLHDTPAKNLFTLNDREVSNGCVRVEQILPLASLALTDDPESGLDRVRKTIASRQTASIPLDDPLPLYMLYWTAKVDSDGNVEFKPDRYDRDRPLIAALADSSRSRSQEIRSSRR